MDRASVQIKHAILIKVFLQKDDYKAKRTAPKENSGLQLSFEWSQIIGFHQQLCC